MSTEEIVIDVLVSGKLVDSLEKGVDATCDTIADVADAAIRISCPAYGSAVEAAEAAQKAASTTTTAAIPSIADMRHKIFRYIAEQTELDHVIQEFVDAWHAIPAPLRKAAQDAFAVGRSVSEFFKDPSFARVLDVAKSIGTVATLTYRVVAYAGAYAAAKLVDGAEWLVNTASRYPEPMAKMLNVMEAPVLAEVVRATSLDPNSIVEGVLGVNPADVGSLLGSVADGDVIAVGEKAIKIVAKPVTAVVNVVDDALDFIGL